MHQIYRQPTGQIWEHKGSKTTPIEFDGVSGNPKSQHPGYIPLYGRKRYTKLSFNYGDINTFGPDLRYSYDSQLYYRDGQTDITGHQASGDKVKDYSKEGYAVTTAYEVVRPNNWFGSSALATISSSGALITDGDKLVQNTIEIYDADKYKSSYNAIPLSVGQGNLAGQGMIRTMMLLDSSVPEEQIEEYPDSDGSGGLSRNYQMYAIGLWKGETYKYQTYIEVTYTPPNKSDLAAISIDAGSCVLSGSSTNLTIKFKNAGISIPSGSSFKVTVAADGVVFKTFTYTAGLPPGETKTETVPYTFNSTKASR